MPRQHPDQLVVRLPHELADDFRRATARSGQTRSEVLRVLVAAYIETIAQSHDDERPAVPRGAVNDPTAVRGRSRAPA